jgi:hypothetical protein
MLALQPGPDHSRWGLGRRTVANPNLLTARLIGWSMWCLSVSTPSSADDGAWWQDGRRLVRASVSALEA